MTEQRLHEILGQNVEAPAMVDNKLKSTYTQLEGRERPAKRKGVRPVRMALVAAALVVIGVLCIAAGVPYKIYNFLSGGSVAVVPESSGIIGGAEMEVPNEKNAPLVLENGRLWFVNNGERTDVTDLIDENTPYIYENVDPATGNKGYVILGGTVDDFGWAEYADLDGCAGMMGDNFAQYYVILDGERFLLTELTSSQMQQIHDMSEIGEDGVDRASGLESETVYRPWLTAAMEQLGIKNY